jgi:hypothetical protein
MKHHSSKTNEKPIDAVITWVDGSDPVLTEKRNIYLESAKDIHMHETQPTFYASNNEIRYCVLSILKFAPFIRNIYIITDGQDPDLYQEVDTYFPGRSRSLKIVDHKEIYKGYEQYLPVFNSTSILTMVWRIDGLSNHFVFFNDDVFLIRNYKPEDWFLNGKPILRGNWLFPPYWKMLGNFYKILINRHIKGVEKYKPKLSFFIRQWNTAKMLGYNYRYFFHCHYPHPINRDTIEEYYSENKELFELNSSSRFKKSDQFLLGALVYHLEITKGGVSLKTPNHCYIHPVYSRQKIYRKINRCNQNDNIRTVCVQNMDVLDKRLQTDIFSWMDKILDLH